MCTNTSSPHCRLVSPRGMPLVFDANNNKCAGNKWLTVECYCKWYTYMLVTFGDRGIPTVAEVEFCEAEPLFDGTAYCDHVPNPLAMRKLGKARNWWVDECAYEMVVGRWETEYKSNYHESGNE